jgi:hypothetical protein
MFLKSMVAVMAASMRALRLFERSIARRSAAALAFERGPRPPDEDSPGRERGSGRLMMMEH